MGGVVDERDRVSADRTIELTVARGVDANSTERLLPVGSIEDHYLSLMSSRSDRGNRPRKTILLSYLGQGNH
jgi:hypothetical protein